ncbi:hypothetical protein CVIRNUC_009361 [Coccomyxa viridis]|uniref:Uncharacterized protein n=1 Tax=Coccomyxa viridis TaxID=1274662 RepID=A0AAV1IJP6_9CHLO|nr:hypothetical protein CVIRNUC_009361 [Coccomyxa viridis]
MGLRHALSPLSSTCAPEAPIQEPKEALVAEALQSSCGSSLLSGFAISGVWCLQSGASLKGSSRIAALPPRHTAPSLGDICGLYALQNVQESATHSPQCGPGIPKSQKRLFGLVTAGRKLRLHDPVKCTTGASIILQATGAL